MSLQHIVLRDFVIVRELDLDLSSGFTALTGETGAGKSILIDALQLVLGARADTGVSREGATRTEICAEFTTTPEVLTWLQDEGFADIAAEDGLLLKRTIDTQGKSRAWINGSPATATQLRALGDLVLDIHGQHAWQSLTRADAVRGCCPSSPPCPPPAPPAAAADARTRAAGTTRAPGLAAPRAAQAVCHVAPKPG